MKSQIRAQHGSALKQGHQVHQGPGFEEEIAGMKKDETKSFKVTFPTNYVKELAGKEAQFTVTLHEVKEKKIPAADDAAVKELGIKEVTTIAELKARIKELENKN